MTAKKTPRTFSSSKLVKIISKKNLTIKALFGKMESAGSKVTERTLRNWEAGMTQPIANELAILAFVLGVSINAFFE